MHICMYTTVEQVLRNLYFVSFTLPCFLCGNVCACVHQKMQELLSEQEGIKEAYEQLEGEYMLVETELSAARDRIAKLLAHLEK